MPKPIKFAIAVLLKNPSDNNKFLAVKRPPEDRLANVWGLPAASVKENELPEDAVRRVGTEKLCTKIEPTAFIGIKYDDRGDYNLILADIEARLVGEEPNVANSKSLSTRYIGQQWTNDYTKLIEAASKGSLCSQIVLDKKNIKY